MEENECSVYAQEGTAAHALAEIKLSYRFGKISVSKYQERFEEFTTSEHGKYYNKEFEEYVDEFVEYVIQQTENIGDYHIYFELKVNFSNIVPQGFGTADVVIVTEDTIHVIDLKFGVGVPVCAHENQQLRLYGLGVLNLFPNSNRVKMTIHQPRLCSQDSEELTKKELLDWGINFVRPRADEAIKGEGILQASDEACRFCKLRGKCKVRADAQLAVAQREFAIIEQKQQTVESMSPEQIANVLEIAPFFINWFKDVQAHAYNELAKGNKIPGYKLVEGRSNRIMTDEGKIKEILLSVGLKEEQIMKPAKLQGISYLEALVGKKLFAEMCKDYLIKPMGKVTLVPESDKRPAITKLAIAQSDFAEIEEE